MSERLLAMRDLRWWDLAAVHVIEEASFPDTAWSIETFWSELAGVPETRRYWVIEEGDQVVGYAGLMSVVPEADIQTIAVSSEYRDRGIGAQLLTAAMAEARDRGCRHLMLEVTSDNAPARRLYERHGFEVIAQRSNYYGQGRDALMMRAVLTSPPPETMA
jgi:ribosomal-protein-alanine N-acetyltransferase